MGITLHRDAVASEPREVRKTWLRWQVVAVDTTQSADYVVAATDDRRDAEAVKDALNARGMLASIRKDPEWVALVEEIERRPKRPVEADGIQLRRPIDVTLALAEVEG